MNKRIVAHEKSLGVIVGEPMAQGSTLVASWSGGS